MALYLDQQTRPVLKRIIKKWQEAHPKDFVADRIMGSIISDENRLEEISLCQHTTARYVGNKTCCSKCGSYYDPGMGFNWQLWRPERQLFPASGNGKPHKTRPREEAGPNGYL